MNGTGAQSSGSSDTEFTEKATNLNRITEQIIGAAIEVHRVLGPGLLESTYQTALSHELTMRSVAFEEQKNCSVKYKQLSVQDAYEIDFLVDNTVVVEIKSVEALLEIHEAQVLTYLRFTGCRIGLLINFKTSFLTRNGLRRLAL